MTESFANISEEENIIIISLTIKLLALTIRNILIKCTRGSNSYIYNTYRIVLILVTITATI